MVDNVTITAGSGTTIAADDIGAGVLAQRVKPVWGPDGTGNDIDVAAGKPLPVQLRGSDGTDVGTTLGTKLDTIAADIVSATGVVGAGTEAAALRVTLSTDGTGVVVPVFHGIGPLSLASNATGTTYNPFASQACKQVTLINDTGVDLELQLGATGTTFILWANSALTIPGITNASTIGYRRKDTSNTVVTLTGFWNA